MTDIVKRLENESTMFHTQRECELYEEAAKEITLLRNKLSLAIENIEQRCETCGFYST